MADVAEELIRLHTCLDRRECPKCHAELGREHDEPWAFYRCACGFCIERREPPGGPSMRPAS